MARDIDDQIAKVEDLDLRLVALVGTAEQRAHAGHELAGREGLDEVVVRAELEADDTVLDLALGRQHDDGHIGGIADGAADALARELGEHEVEHDEVELMLLELFNGRLTIADADDPVALALEVRRHGVANGLLVLDEQDFPCVRSHNQASLSHLERTSTLYRTRR